MSVLAVVLWATITLSAAKEVKFPPWFQFGASTASYQVEGGWNASDKGENIWDRFTHADPTVIADLSNGDVACDSYHLWRRDVDMAVELGLHFYRFSLSWTRILPSGFSDQISAAGSKYYSDLIDALLEKGIEPVVTLYHWDLPQRLQDLGGWTNPLVVDWFTSYARVAFSLYADRVKTWITLNEPLSMCDLTYTTGIFAPGIEDTTFAPFLCNRHLLLSHASAWRIYDKDFKPLYHGRVSISNHIIWFSEYSRKDYALTKIARDYGTGRYTNAIYSKEGGWPASVEKIMKEVSSKQGYDVSRLPPFSEEEVQFIKGTYDFFALNYYICRKVRHAKPGEKVEAMIFYGIPELRAVLEGDPTLPRVSADTLTIQNCPKGLRSLLAWIKEQYGNQEIFITESGYSDKSRDLRDDGRISYIRDHLEQVLLSINVDLVNVTAYTYWSLMDNLEWINGYKSKFGLYDVDFKSEARTRTPRSSANFYSQVIRRHTLRLNTSDANSLP